MTLEERYKRNAIEDQLYLGELVERTLNSEFGSFLKALTTGLYAEWLALSETDGKLSADRYLGRIESLNKLLDRLEYCIEAKRRLLEEQRKSQRVEPSGELVQPQGIQ